MSNDDLFPMADIDPIDKLRIACNLLTECEYIIGTVDPECSSEAELISKLRAQIVDFLADSGVVAPELF